METTIIVKFIKPFEVYCKGDVAGFSDEVAQKLLNDKTAILFDGMEDTLHSPADPMICPDWQKRLPEQGAEVLICPICGDKPESFELLCKHKKEKHGIE